MKVELSHTLTTLGQLRQGTTFLRDGMAYCVCYDSLARPTEDSVACFRFDGGLVIWMDALSLVEPRPMKVVDDVEDESCRDS